jgi:hypothetical protein
VLSPTRPVNFVSLPVSYIRHQDSRR